MEKVFDKKRQYPSEIEKLSNFSKMHKANLHEGYNALKSLTMYKNDQAKIVAVPKKYSLAKCNSIYNSKNSSINQDIKENKASNFVIEDIARENRLSKIISLYSKGLNQEEVAEELCINQSTVSRDLQLSNRKQENKLKSVYAGLKG